jgi:hypothetical protein
MIRLVNKFTNHIQNRLGHFVVSLNIYKLKNNVYMLPYNSN